VLNEHDVVLARPSEILSNVTYNLMLFITVLRITAMPSVGSPSALTRFAFSKGCYCVLVAVLAHGSTLNAVDELYVNN
jgi:hypothetical protein